jgi:hypothetical protein
MTVTHTYNLALAYLKAKNSLRLAAEAHASAQHEFDRVQRCLSESITLGIGEKVCIQVPGGRVLIVSMYENYSTSIEVCDFWEAEKSGETEIPTGENLDIPAIFLDPINALESLENQDAHGVYMIQHSLFSIEWRWSELGSAVVLQRTVTRKGDVQITNYWEHQK